MRYYIARLKNLSTHDLADLVDLLEHRLGEEDIVRLRRRGKAPLTVAREQASDGPRVATEPKYTLSSVDVHLNHRTL